MCDPPTTTTTTTISKGVCEASTESSSSSTSVTTKTDAVSSLASSYALGHAADGTPIVHTARPTVESILQQRSKVDQGEKKDQRLLAVGVGGNWYDVTSYIPYHPGGDVILEFVGRDATAQFMAYHSPQVLKKRTPVGTYEFDAIRPGGEVMEGEWMALSDKYERLGYYHTPLWFVWSRLVILAAFLCTTLACVYVYTQGMLFGEWMSRWILVVGSIALAGFWQQSGMYK